MTYCARHQARALGIILSVVALVIMHPVSADAAPDTGVVGTPWTWGGNDFGQLGDGTTTDRLTAGTVNGIDDVVDLHGGREHVIALRSDGTVWVWGSNVEGQLGLGTTGNRSTPVRVGSLSDVVAVETGHNFSLALTADGDVWSWGLNSDGQLGDGTTTMRRSPVRVTGLDDAIAIAAGRDMSYAIRADRTVVAWGRNAEGQLGDGTTVMRRAPVPVSGLTGVTHVAGGRDHGLAVRDDRTVWAWGANDYGQVGDGSTVDRTTARQVQTDAVDVAGGAHHSYALLSDGRVSSWGRNYRANLGDGTTTMRTRPVTVLGVTDAVSLGSGRDSGVVVRAGGQVQVWGHNAYGQLGDGTTTNRTSAVTVPGVSGAVKAGGGGSAYLVVLIGTTTAPVNEAPTADIAVSCDALACTFDGSGSTDSDGVIAGYTWDFGDGGTSTDEEPDHTYTEAGSYEVTLTVTDDDGAVDTTARQLDVSGEDPTVPVSFRAGSGNDRNTQQASVVVPALVQTDDRLLLVVTTNRAATAATPAGWTLLGTQSDGAEVRSWLFTRVATAANAGSTVTVQLDAYSKTSTVLLAYADAGAPTAESSFEQGSSASHVAPSVAGSHGAGSAVVRLWVDKASTAHTWATPAAHVQRATTAGSGSGMLTAMSADLIQPAAGGVATLSATSGLSSSKAIAWTAVLPPE